MKHVLLLLFFFGGYAAFAQQEIKIEDAQNHVGDSVKICDRVFGGVYLPNVKGQPTLLDIGDKYPKAPLTIVIWGDARKEFGGAPDEIYKDVQVCISGKIELHNGKYQIVIQHKSQMVSL